MGMKLRVVSVGMVATIGLLVALAGCGSGSDRPAGSDGGGPITVEQLLPRSADTPIAVRGLLHVEGGVVRLCASIRESYPPQCGDPSVELVGLDVSTVEGTTTSEGVTWKEGVVVNLQRDADGRFAVVDGNVERAVEVTLGIYSGMPDPVWTLTPGQATDLAAALARLSRVDESAPTGGLGYHGFTVVTPERTLVAYDAKVASVSSDPPYVLYDPDRTIERFLLATAPPKLTAEERRAVTDALDG